MKREAAKKKDDDKSEAWVPVGTPTAAGMKLASDIARRGHYLYAKVEWDSNAYDHASVPTIRAHVASFFNVLATHGGVSPQLGTIGRVRVFDIDVKKKTASAMFYSTAALTMPETINVIESD